MESAISTWDIQRPRKNKRQKKSQLRQTEHLTQIRLFRFLCHPGLTSKMPQTFQLRQKENSSSVLLFMNSDFSQAEQRNLQWPCLSQVTLILPHAQETWQMFGTLSPEDAEQITSFSVLHLLPQGQECCHAELWWGQITVISVCQHHLELGDGSISSMTWGKGETIIKIEKSDINSWHGDFPSTWEVAAGGLLWVWSQLLLKGEFQATNDILPPKTKKAKTVFSPQTAPSWWKWSAVTLDYSASHSQCLQRAIELSRSSAKQA